MGSINTSDYEKKQFAAQSLEYNLKDKLFCELFPETVEVSMLEKGNICWPGQISKRISVSRR